MNFAIFKQQSDGQLGAWVTDESKEAFKQDFEKNSGPISILHFEEIGNYLGHNTASLADACMVFDDVMNGSMHAMLSGLIQHTYDLGYKRGYSSGMRACRKKTATRR